MRAKAIRLTRLASVLAGALLPASLAAQATSVRQVTLEEAVQLALRNNPLVVAARGELDVQEANRREAMGSWLPSLSASSGMSRGSSTRYISETGQNVNVTSPFSYSARLSASYELFDGFRRIHRNRAAGANTASAEAALVNQGFQVTLQTKQAFYDAVHATELERQAETQVQRAREQLSVSKEKLAAGAVIRSDTLRATVEYGSAQLALLTAQAQRATAEASLARLIGVEEAVHVVVGSAILAVTDVDTVAIRTEALQNAPSIAQAEARSRAGEAQVGAARAEYFPRLSAGFSTSRSGTEVDALNASWSLGFSLSWSLFNGFSRETSMATALAGLKTAEAEAADARRQVNVQVTQQLANLATARTQLGIALASQAAAEEDLRVQQERYRQGVGTIVEVLTAQQSLDQAEVAAVNARRAYQIAKANLEALVGREL